MKLIRITLFLQIVVVLVWVTTMSSMRLPSMAAFEVLTSALPFHAILGCIALWCLFTKKGARLLAVVTLLLPVPAFFLPNIIQDLAGGPILASGNALNGFFILLLVGLAGFAIGFPRKAALFVPDFMFRSFGWNLAAVVVTVLSLLLPVLGLVLAFQRGGLLTGVDNAAAPLATVVVFFILANLIGIGLISVPTFLLGYLGLRGHAIQPPKHRRLHIVQLVVSSPPTAGLVFLSISYAVRGESILLKISNAI